MSDSECDPINTPVSSSDHQGLVSEESQFEVKLFSKLPDKFQIPGDKMVVPGNLTRIDLSELVNETLCFEKRVPFDFLIRGEFLRDSLSSHCVERGILSEKTLEIEYVIAMEEPNSTDLTLPQTDWVSGISCGVESMFTCSMDGVLTKYELQSGKLISSTQQSSLPLTGIALSDNGVVMSCGRDGLIRFASDESLKLMETGKVDSGMTVLSLCPWDHSLVLTGSVDGSVHLWNVPASKPLTKSDKSKKRALEESLPPRSVVLKTDSSVSGISWLSLSRAVVASQDGTLRVFDPMSGECLPTISISRQISAMTCLGTRRLVTGHPDGRIIFWTMRFDGSSSSCLLEAANSCRSHSRLVSVLSARPESEYMVAAGCLDGKVKLFDCRASHFAVQSVSLPEKERVLAVRWVSENRFLSGGSDGRVRVHDIETIDE